MYKRYDFAGFFCIISRSKVHSYEEYLEINICVFLNFHDKGKVRFTLYISKRNCKYSKLILLLITSCIWFLFLLSYFMILQNSDNLKIFVFCVFIILHHLKN